MAHVRTHTTSQRRNGKAIKRYEVAWREPTRDSFGLPIPVNAAYPDGPTRCSRGRRPTRPGRLLETIQAKAVPIRSVGQRAGVTPPSPIYLPAFRR
jgi:hypothetical protein